MQSVPNASDIQRSLPKVPVHYRLYWDIYGKAIYPKSPCADLLELQAPQYCKIFIAITPSGTISYISPCWGGRVSDKCLTQNCGFLNLLEHGDTVFADRGFSISEDLAIHGATLAIPSFTKGKSQLSQQEVEYSQRLAKVQIHVECYWMIENQVHNPAECSPCISCQAC